MSDNFLIYGSYGYTGDLIAREAVARGLRPILAGRDPQRLAQQAAELGLQHVAFSLDDRPAMDMALGQVAVVLHCAGPFSRTSRSMADGCLRNRVHYLDITGEIAVFEALARRGAEAQAAGVMLLPGAGFDVAPSDCLAAHLKRRLPTADRLALGIRGLGSGISRGTATTGVESIGLATWVRRDGRLMAVPPGSLTRDINYGRGMETSVAIGWGDVSTAYHSTGIPNIEVYFAFPRAMRWGLRGTRYLNPVLSSRPVQRALKAAIQRQPPGPTAEQRARGRNLLWGEVRNPAGQRRVSRLSTPEAYTLTVLSALAIVEKVLAGQVKPGFQTPPLGYGPDLVLELPGVAREDIAQ
ncbi:MAG TPA: saccharopine dehydrogenase NADP-binding domain-containing protein [Anaerolineae bacterium]|nr:saccharopine dehydrogenase NADP-binding domain-containing protein [Anaerolineae bacterium]